MRKSSHPQSSSSAKALLAAHREALAAVKSLPRRSATLSLGCPSFGGQRAVGCHSTATVSAHLPHRALWRRRCLRQSPSQSGHGRTGAVCAGCPSFGGQRTLGCHSTTIVGVPRSFALCCAVERFRVRGFGLYASAPRPHRPNPAFEPTATGKPASAAQLPR